MCWCLLSYLIWIGCFSAPPTLLLLFDPAAALPPHEQPNPNKTEEVNYSLFFTFTCFAFLDWIGSSWGDWIGLDRGDCVAVLGLGWIESG